MTGQKRSLLAILSTLALALCVIVGISGCSTTVQEDPSTTVKNALSASLDGIKSPDSSEIETIIGSDTYTELQKYGVDPQTFYQSLVSRFSYEIKDVSVDSSGNTATVTVSATNIDVQQVFSSWMTEFEAYATSSDGLALIMSGDSDSLVKQAMQMLETDLAKTDNPTKTADVTVTMTKGSDGTWKLDNDDELSNILFVGQNLNDLGNTLSSGTGTGASTDAGSTSAATTETTYMS